MSRIYDEVDPSYATACSDVTLCSNSKGFFRTLAEDVVQLADASGWLQTFENAPDAEKVAVVLENKELMSSLSEVLSRVRPLNRGKDARASHERRASAAAALTAGRLDAAMALACQAVLRAPMTGSEEAVDDGVSLALALWTRAEALQRLGNARAALSDLRLALRERLPARMRSHYYWRMGHCYRDAGEPTRAKVSYELASRLLASDEAAKAQLEQDVAGLDFTVQPKQPLEKTCISVTGGAKQNMPALSKLVKIAEEENKGRFAVANSSIRTGDVLLVDSPYAACLLTDCYGSYCLHCFKRLEDCEEEAPIWCPKCSAIAFCSVKCRDTAVSTYHAYECQFLDLFIGSGMSILSHIALRMVTQAGLATSLSIHSKYISNEVKTVEGSALNDVEGLAKKSKMKSRKERLNRAKKGMKTLNEKYGRDNETKENQGTKIEDKMSFEEKLELKASQIYALCTHSEQRKGSDYLKRIVMGLFLTECLKQAGFFKNCEKEELQKAEKALCELIVRNLQLLQFNAHEIYETVRGPHLFSGSKPVYIAVGIYPTGALFNHECYPAVARYFEGRNIVLRAIRPLEPGEVVSENYGPHFMVRPRGDRQRSLTSRYWFRCGCVACTEDWPTLKQMPKDAPPYLRCPNLSCSGKFRAIAQSLPARCPRCASNIDKELVKINVQNIDRCIDKYQEGAQLMDEERAEHAITVIAEGIDIFHEIACPPHRDTHIAQEALRSCFAAFGNVHQVRSTTQDQNTPSCISSSIISPVNGTNEPSQ